MTKEQLQKELYLVNKAYEKGLKLPKSEANCKYLNKLFAKKQLLQKQLDHFRQ